MRFVVYAEVEPAPGILDLAVYHSPGRSNKDCLRTWIGGMSSPFFAQRTGPFQPTSLRAISLSQLADLSLQSNCSMPPLKYTPWKKAVYPDPLNTSSKSRSWRYCLPSAYPRQGRHCCLSPCYARAFRLLPLMPFILGSSCPSGHQVGGREGSLLPLFLFLWRAPPVVARCDSSESEQLILPEGVLVEFV